MTLTLAPRQETRMPELRKLTRDETIHWLLETLPAVRDPLQTSGTPGEGNGVIAMPHAYHHGSYPELERCLQEMRRRGKQEHLTWTDRHGDHRDSLQSGLWQLDNYYFNALRKSVPNTRIVRGKNGRRHTIKTGTYRIEIIRHPDVREAKVKAARHWISHEFNGPPFLPLEILAHVAA